MSELLRKATTSIEEQDLRSRVEIVNKAVASARIEGIEITASTKASFDRFACGDVDEDDMMEEVLAKYGPRA